MGKVVRQILGRDIPRTALAILVGELIQTLSDCSRPESAATNNKARNLGGGGP
jgi:hypothetical protein